MDTKNKLTTNGYNFKEMIQFMTLEKRKEKMSALLENKIK